MKKLMRYALYKDPGAKSQEETEQPADEAAGNAEGSGSDEGSGDSSSEGQE